MKSSLHFSLFATGQVLRGKKVRLSRLWEQNAKSTRKKGRKVWKNWKARDGENYLKPRWRRQQRNDIYDECIKEPSWWFIYFIFCHFFFYFFLLSASFSALGFFFLEASAIAINEMKRTTTTTNGASGCRGCGCRLNITRRHKNWQTSSPDKGQTNFWMNHPSGALKKS